MSFSTSELKLDLPMTAGSESTPTPKANLQVAVSSAATPTPKVEPQKTGRSEATPTPKLCSQGNSAESTPSSAMSMKGLLAAIDAEDDTEERTPLASEKTSLASDKKPEPKSRKKHEPGMFKFSRDSIIHNLKGTDLAQYLMQLDPKERKSYWLTLDPDAKASLKGTEFKNEVEPETPKSALSSMGIF